MELVYDTTRWRALPAGEGALRMQPIGTIARRLDPVRVAMAPSEAADACEALARSQLFLSHYGTPTSRSTEVAGVPALRFVAHTRCRNAMPKGELVCVPYRGNSYALAVSTISCQSGAHNLFSGIDPLKELLDGVRFKP
jgi:hypothetical protein